MDYIKEYEKWKKIGFLDKELKDELKKIEGDKVAIENQFSEYVEFGTAGMRGTMGVGPGRMNKITVRRTTVGFAKYIKKYKGEKKGVVIIHDSRINSKMFAHYIAEVLSEYGIKTFVSSDIRPTPFLSFAVLEMKAFAGINITASHNRKEDNGYKIYLSDGAQMSSPEDKEIIKAVNDVTEKEMFASPKEVKVNKKYINVISKKVEDSFLNHALDIVMHKDFCKKHGKELKVAYTPLHGTGYIFLKDGFKKAGFTNVKIVKSQNDECGLFKTVAYPNPESSLAFVEALKLARANDSDLIIATDPDADRLGVYVRVKKDEYVALTGNELAACIFAYVIYFKSKAKVDMKKSFVAKSFVTTRLLDAIADRFGIEMKVTPTGFKWIGKEMNKSKKTFLFGAEESYGAVLSGYVRDKDAVGTALLVCEMALALKKANLTLYDLLHLLYNEYGVYKNFAFSITCEGVAGKEKIRSMMKELREKPFTKLTDIESVFMYDYKDTNVYDFKTKKKSHFDFVPNDTLKYIMSDNSNITIRPSGTEPKIKMYIDVVDKTEELAENKNKILESALRKLLK